MSVQLSEIITCVKATTNFTVSNEAISHVSIDSRSIQNHNGTLFFALIGNNYDAHDYIPELIAKGVHFFVVEKIPENYKTNAFFLKVDNTLDALQNFAAFYRNKFNFPVIGITGSNGKTIVKEWLNFLLSPDFHIIRSPKSYNSQVGVPLSVIGINEYHNFGIFEAGISRTEEMQKLQQIIQPTIGILTNIGTAHDEGFENVSEKIKEKLKLFVNTDVLIFEKNQTVETFASQCNIKSFFTWSSKDRNATVFVQKLSTESVSEYVVLYQDRKFTISIPFIDEASVENSLHCVASMLYLNYSEEIIRTRISELFPVEMRLKVKNGINNCTLIDDSYSSDFQSLKIALDFLENQKQHTKRSLILSDIYQSGLTDDELYCRVSQLIVAHKINRVFCVGKTISKYKNKFVNAFSFQSTEEFIKSFKSISFLNETILIKGSRNFEFETVVKLLEEKTHETILEVNLSAISHNLNFYKAKLKPETKLMAMVKAFGYGSGSYEIAKLLAHHKIDYLGVAFADEGIELRKAGITTPIMVMNPEMTSFQSIIDNSLEPEIYSLRSLQAFLECVTENNLSNFPIHIKLNTGMNRLGFDENDITELISVLKSNNRLKVISILSHFASSDVIEHDDFTKNQIEEFTSLSNQIVTEIEYKPILHMCNTSGISNYPEAQFDMVRLGIGLYGVSNDKNEQSKLENVSTLKSVISQIRTIKKGESVGYSRRFVAENVTDIATIPIGYADGISRLWGNGVGYVTVNGKKAPIVGSICMDMLMIDVTNINCIEGNEVIIFGKNPTVNTIAEATKTIPYEILTSISSRVKRIFFRE